MDKEFQIQLDLSFYDVLMFAQAIAHARRYGDNQLSDWAADVRERLQKLASSLPSAQVFSSEINLEKVVDSSITDQADGIVQDVGKEDTFPLPSAGKRRSKSESKAETDTE